MRAFPAVVVGSIGALVIAATSALAVETPPRTIEQCAKLLPPGKTYSFQITGTIDMTQSAPVLRCEFTIDDGTQVDRRSEGEAFGKCIAPLMKQQ